MRPGGERGLDFQRLADAFLPLYPKSSDDKWLPDETLLALPGKGRAEFEGRGTMTPAGRIEINPRVMLGKPVIRGTRIPVELILRKLSEGATDKDLLDAYPRLTREDIRAAVRYAADVVAHEETVLVGLAQSAADA